MDKVFQDQQSLKDTLRDLQQENQELRMRHEELQRAVAIAGGAPPPKYQRPAGSWGNDNHEVLRFESSIQIHDAPVHCVAMRKSNEIVATASWDQTVKLYNLKTKEVVKTLGD